MTCDASGDTFVTLPTRPSFGDYRILETHPVLRARRDQKLLVIRGRRPGDHPGRDGREVLWEGWAVDEGKRLAETLVLLRRRPGEDQLVAQRLNLGLKVVPDRLRVDEVGDVPVRIRNGCAIRSPATWNGVSTARPSRGAPCSAPSSDSRR